MPVLSHRRSVCEKAVGALPTGDRSALATLYDCMGRSLFSVAYAVTGNWHDAEDVLQETLLGGGTAATGTVDAGCSAFTALEADGTVRMGRNYDFKNDTSALLVYCTPKNGYKSVALAALDNISANDPLASLKSKLTCLTVPFICLDGMNEKGVSIAVLTLDSEPTVQSTGKRAIGTSLAIRLVLDQAATTQEAVDLLRGYDMIASNGRDYHFYITDASGDGRIVEYDCLSETRELVDTPIRSITNFFALYADRVQPDQKNDIFGHGKERYEKIEAILTAAADSITEDDAWDALKAASQLPKEGDVTSNTQWSALYNDTDLTLDLILRRDWDVVTSYSLTENAIR